MYEKSILRLKERNQKVKKIEREMLKECTFLPSINSLSTVNDRNDLIVWNRLYPKLKRTPGKSNSWRKSPMSVSTHSSGSSRLDKLYQEGVQRSISRPGRTDKEEEEVRRERFEELKLRNCTFKPTLRWTVKTLSPKKRLSPLRSWLKKSSSTSHACKTPPRISKSSAAVPSSTPESYKSCFRSHYPPVSVIDTTTSSIGFDSLIVSPLRDPSFATSSISNSKCEESSDSMIEYGSI
mmetsp:Transcript_5202/g.6056  ORF Transcript_5202/g.6056 Transcript_5202/m.6056 type:complete len:237 (+) Transcript_5202:263-973(+)